MWRKKPGEGENREKISLNRHFEGEKREGMVRLGGVPKKISKEGLKGPKKGGGGDLLKGPLTASQSQSTH